MDANTYNVLIHAINTVGISFQALVQTALIVYVIRDVILAIAGGRIQPIKR